MMIMTNRNILILCSGYLDSTSANGVCSRNLAEYFISQGHNVWVIAVSPVEINTPINVNGVKVYGIPNASNVQSIDNAVNNASSYGRFKLATYRVFWGMLAVFCYPRAVIRTRVNIVYKLSVDLIDTHNIDVVLATSFPYDSIEVGEKLKKKYDKRIRVVTFHFDLLFYPNNTNRIAYNYKRSRFLKAFKKECSVVDKVLLPETFKEEIKYKNVQKVGFPVYCDSYDCSASDLIFDPEYINISYIGTLDRTNRNPEQIIKCLDAIIRRYGLKIHLHIWGAIRGDDVVSMIGGYSFVKYYGSIDNQYVQDIYKKSDYLLNIANKMLYNLLPSKIFQFFYSGKPIINFVQNKNDVSLDYFNEYKNSINIFPNESHDWEVDLYRFIMAEHELETNKSSFM